MIISEKQIMELITYLSEAVFKMYPIGWGEGVVELLGEINSQQSEELKEVK